LSEKTTLYCIWLYNYKWRKCHRYILLSLFTS